MTTNNLKAGTGATLKVPYILNVCCTMGDFKNKNMFNLAALKRCGWIHLGTVDMK
jgi:hypothetical protein